LSVIYLVNFAVAFQYILDTLSTGSDLAIYRLRISLVVKS